jgi:hypothetical protein
MPAYGESPGSLSPTTLNAVDAATRRRPAVGHIDMDVHKQDTQVCIDAVGTVVLEERIRTTRERFTALRGGRPRAHILLDPEPGNLRVK